MDQEQNRIEQIRWQIMRTLHYMRPDPVAEPLILSAIQAIPIQCTARELRRELDYLSDRGFVKLTRPEGRAWLGDLTRSGVDFVEYNLEAQPGIARPKKYWDA